MKAISLPSHIYMHSTGGTPVEYDAAVQHALEARQNVNAVISASLLIEREIEALINNFLFPTEPASGQKVFVASHILGSDLPFAAKRRMLVALAKEKSWLSDKEADEFDQLLIKVGKRRNALAHGSVIERDQTTILKYFEAGPREDELTDEFWDRVVDLFKRTIERVEQLKSAAKNQGFPAA